MIFQQLQSSRKYPVWELGDLMVVPQRRDSVSIAFSEIINILWAGLEALVGWIWPAGCQLTITA